ncbi:MAG: hypothetical protein K6A69_09710 [Lachnospiraceae bacterium]|nr:hypothetical protein [Lachnospiraceae bacterium]
MITAITNKNIEVFEHLIPDDIRAELLERKDYAAIGVIRIIDGRPEAMGSLVYNTDETEDGEKYFRLRWIYVMEEYIRSGVGSELLMEFFWNALNLNPGFILCDVPSSIDNEDLITFLGLYGFEFRPTELPTAEVPVKKLVNADKIKKMKVLAKTADIVPFNDITDKEFDIVCRNMREYRRNNDEFIDKCIKNANKDYYDNRISALFRNGEGKFTCAAFVRRDAYDNFRVVALGGVKESSGNDAAALIGYVVNEMAKACAPDSTVQIDLHTEKQISVARSIVGEAAFPVVLRGLISCELDNMDMDEWEGYKERSIQAIRDAAEE